MTFTGVLASVAATSLLVGAASNDAPPPPPHEPFVKWAPESTTERRLDELITEAVDILEKAAPGSEFKEWQTRNIKSEFGELHLIVRQTPHGRYTGKNFLFQNSEFGTYFYARLKLSKLRFFVPSACIARTELDKRADEVKFRWEGIPPIPSSHPGASETKDNPWKAVTPLYEMSCGKTVKIRLYDSALLRAHNDFQRNRNPAGKGAPLGDHFWIGLSIYRSQGLR